MNILSSILIFSVLFAVYAEKSTSKDGCDELIEIIDQELEIFDFSFMSFGLAKKMAIAKILINLDEEDTMSQDSKGKQWTDIITLTSLNNNLALIKMGEMRAKIYGLCNKSKEKQIL